MDSIFLRSSNKKGNIITNGAFFMIVVITVGLMYILLSDVITDLNNEVQQDTTLENSSKARFNEFSTNYPSYYDSIIVFIVVMLTLFLIGSVFVVDTQPMFFIIALVLMVVLIISAAYLSNSIEDIITSDSDISEEADKFPYTSWILTHLVEVIIGIVFMVLLAMFAKFRSGL